MSRKKIYVDVSININGSKVYPGESFFILFSKNIVVINANNLRPIFNRSYISKTRVYIKEPPPSVIKQSSRNKIITFLHLL